MVSLRPNCFIFIGHIKTGGGERGGGLRLTSSGSATGTYIVIFSKEITPINISLWLYAGATLETTIVIGVMKTSGIFFVNFQQRFNSTSSMTALLSTVLNAVYSVTGMSSKINFQVLQYRYRYSLEFVTAQLFSLRIEGSYQIL